MADSPAIDKRGLEILSRSECEALLSGGTIGRIGLQVAGETLVLPVLYRFAEGNVVFRTSPGEKLDAAWVNAAAAFEIDDWDIPSRSGWSVLVRGRTEEVTDQEDIASLERLDLESWTPAVPRTTWIRIRPSDITGRRIR